MRRHDPVDDQIDGLAFHADETVPMQGFADVASFLD
jgi:hypothetical protein